MNSRYFLLSLMVGLSGCVIHTEHTGTTEYSSSAQTIDPAVKQLHVTLHMGAGELRVVDTGQEVVRGDFTYNVPDWKPLFHYRTAGDDGNLTIEQPGQNQTYFGNTKYKWDLQLTNKVPLDLTVHFGAGQARLDLASLMLRGVEVHMGVGQLDMDLRGRVKHSYTVTIHGGIGQATVRLPADAAIYAEAHGGIGSIEVHGLRHRGDHWESEAWAGAENRIQVEVHGGIGQIRLIAD
jgi:hypothetical protein